MDSDDDEPGHASGPFCVVWVYRDTPDAFERAARYALQNTGYGLEVVVVLTEQGARLVQRDRLLQMMRLEHIVELMDKLELDIGAARRAGVVQTLGALPGLRVADDQRVAELTTGARMTARY
jgi:hypothetical protein